MEGVIFLADKNRYRNGWYGIRTSLAKTLFDTEIPLTGLSSLYGSKKPMTIRVFVYSMMSLFAYALIFSRTVISAGGFWGILLFTVGYIGCYATLVTRTDTLEYRVNYIPVLFTYWRKNGRRVPTGLLDSGAPFRDLIGIDERKGRQGIDQEGRIYFVDGEVGYLLDVVGYASNLLFDEDKDQVISDARIFYRNLPPRIGVTLITQASVQDVTTQLQSKVNQLNNLAIDSNGLRQVLKKQGLELKHNVGSKFSMIRQYILVRGNKDDVDVALTQLLTGTGSSKKVFVRSARILKNEPLRVGTDGLPLNRPYECSKVVGSILNDH